MKAKTENVEKERGGTDKKRKRLMEWRGPEAERETIISLYTFQLSVLNGLGGQKDSGDEHRERERELLKV